MQKLETILSNEHIPVLRIDRQAGTILTDSFSILPEYCDCGKNFFGAEYPGTRRGQMAISVQDANRTTVKFKFGTLLNITANNKQVICTSFGILEDKILDQLDTELGVARANATN